MGSASSVDKGQTKPTTLNDSNIDNKTEKHHRSGARLIKHDTKISPINTSENVESRNIQPEQTSLEEQLNLARTKLEEMESQMAEVEGQNFKLQDQITALEAQLDWFRNSNSHHHQVLPPVDEDESCTHTLHAKDQYIVHVERETQAVKDDILKLRKKFKRKLRLLNAQLSEAKQSKSVQAFELHQEIQTLTEENRKLLRKVEHLPAATCMDDKNSHQEDVKNGRTSIILELSGKVSEQDDKIIQLELESRRKEKLIEQLQKGINSSDTKTENDRTLRATNPAAEASDGDDSLRQTAKDDETLNEMKSIAEEIGKLRNNKSGKNKGKKSKNSDFRESSGISRDSGVVTFPRKTGSEVNGESCWVDDSDFSDVDTQASTNHGSKPGSAQSRVSVLSSDFTDDDEIEKATGDLISDLGNDLDPASIRRISAAKMRRAKHKKSSENRTVPAAMRGKPPLGPTKGMKDHMDMTEVEKLVGTLDHPRSVLASY